MRSNYKNLWEFIREVKTKNIDGKVKQLLGVNLEKTFIPSVANIVGTDLTAYSVIKKGQFGCKLMSVGRDKKLPVALLREYDEAIISSAYYVFEVIDHDILIDDYLMMWLSRPESDRFLWFISGGDVRGGIGWDSFCSLPIIVPPKKIQKEIVTEYNTIVNRKKLNEQINKKLEEIAKAIYKNWFVDFEFPDENGKPYKSNGNKFKYCSELETDIPINWKCIQLAKYCKEMKSGGTPDRGIPEHWNSKDIAWLKTGEVCNNVVISSEEYISELGLKNSSAKILPINTVLMAMYGDGKTKGQVGLLRFPSTTNQACCSMICHTEQHATYLFYHLLFNRDEIVSIAVGGAQENLSKNIIEKVYILLPDEYVLKNHPFTVFLARIEFLTKMSAELAKLQSTLLQRMTTINQDHY
jgi:type I restriction enzyme, S subunit